MMKLNVDRPDWQGRNALPFGFYFFALLPRNGYNKIMADDQLKMVGRLF